MIHNTLPKPQKDVFNMPLPSPARMEELRLQLRVRSLGEKPAHGTYEKVRNGLWAGFRKSGNAAAETAVQSGVSYAVAAGGVSIAVGGLSYALFPVGMALAPWIAAGRAGMAADGIFAFHDLKDLASGRRRGAYTCSCRKCEEPLQYVINKKEANVGIAALSVFTLGLAMAVDRINSVRKRFQSNRPKELHSKHFVQSAKGGCDVAMATVMMMCGEWDDVPTPELVIEVATCLLADNGWELLKSKW